MKGSPGAVAARRRFAAWRLAAVACAAVAVSGCRSAPQEPPPPVEATEADRQAVVDAFNALLRSVVACDPAAFRDLHTQKAQGAFDALAKHLDPADLDPAAKAESPADNAAVWMCTLARMAGFVPGQAEPVAVAVDVRNGTAKVFFRAHGSEFGFPMARQFGTWRSPFPGYVFLVHEFRSWQDAVAAKLPEGPARDGLAERVGQVVKLLQPFQPNWDEFPEMKPREDPLAP